MFVTLRLKNTISDCPIIVGSEMLSMWFLWAVLDEYLPSYSKTWYHASESAALEISSSYVSVSAYLM